MADYIGPKTKEEAEEILRFSKTIEGIFKQALKDAKTMNDLFAGQLKTSLQEATAEVGNLGRQLDAAKGLTEGTTKNVLEQLNIQEDLVQAKLNEIQAQVAIVQALENQTEESEQLLKNYGKQAKNLRLRLRYYSQIDSETDSIAGNLGLSFSYEKSSLKALMDSSKEIDGAESGYSRIATRLQGMVSLQELGYGFLKKTFSVTKDYTKELIASNKELNKATSMAEQYFDAMEAVAGTYALYGMSLSDAAQHQATLIKGMADFTSESETERELLQGLAAEMSAIGVSVDDFAKSLNYLTKVENKSVKESRKFTKELVLYGRSIGKIPSEFVSEFASATSKLSAHGDKMIAIFKKLQVTSKQAGVEFGTLVDFGQQFDDFGAASDMVAKLNGQFSELNLNALELHQTTDPEQRTKMILRALKATGQLERVMADSTEGYYERLSLASSLNTTPEFLKAMLEADFGKVSKETDDWNAVLSKSSSIMDKISTIFGSIGRFLAPMITFALDGIATGLDYIISGGEGVQLFFASIGVAIGKWASGKIFGGLLKVMESLGNGGFWKAASKGLKLIGGLPGKLMAPFKWLVSNWKFFAWLEGGNVKLLKWIGTASSKLWLLVAPVISLFENFTDVKDTMKDIFSRDFSLDSFLDAALLGFTYLGQAALSVVNGFLWIIDLITFGLSGAFLKLADNVPFLQDIMKGGKFDLLQNTHHDGVTKPAVLKKDEIATSSPSITQSSILTKGNSQTIETLLKDLTVAINKLSSGGGTGGKPVEVVLKLQDGSVLARQVMKNLKYSVA